MPADRCWLRLQLFLLLASINGSWSLRDVAIRVPEAVVTGDTVKLACEYDLEGAALYTIKWYWDDQEFYRYVPKESPAYKIFPLEGINVDQDQSDSRTVTLRSVDRDLTGFYKCEVSADAPLFHTEIKSSAMIVAELPADNPVLTTEKLKYSLGEKIRANCSSSASYPATNITWYLNGQQVSAVMMSPHTKIFLTLLADKEDRESSLSSIELEATSSSFKDGRLRLRCLATLFTLYRRTEEVELVEDTPHLAPVMGPTAPHNHESAASFQTSTHRGHATLAVGIAVAVLLATYASR